MNTEEEEFYLLSLKDLEEEYAAGDIDEKDYRLLKASYTKRLNRVKKGEKAAPIPRPVSGARARPFYLRTTSIVIVGILLLSAAGGTILALSTGQRSPGDEITGDVNTVDNSAIENIDSLEIEELINQADTFLQEGLTESDLLKVESSISLYVAVLERDPSYLNGYVAIATAYYSLGDVQSARQFLLDARTQSPDSVEILANLASLELAESSYDTSQAYLDTIYALEVPEAVLEEARVGVLQELVYAERLISQYGGDTVLTAENLPTQISELGLPDADTASALILILVSEQLQYMEYNLSAFILELLVAEDPENFTLLLDHASFVTNGEIFEPDSAFYNAGVESINQALELNPTSVDALIVRVRAYFGQGRFDEALTDMDRVIELDPDFPDAELFRADLLFEADRLDEALLLLQGLIDEAPDEIAEIAARFTRARFLLLSGMEEESRAEAETILEVVLGATRVINEKAQPTQADQALLQELASYGTAAQQVLDILDQAPEN